MAGEVNIDLDFTYGPETMAYGGCSISFKGELWYFGGNSGVSSSDLYKQVRMKLFLLSQNLERIKIIYQFIHVFR